MSTKSKFLWFGLAILLIVLLQAFKPLGTDLWKIDPNPTRLANKLEYLQNLDLPDSVKKMNVVIIMADDLGKYDVSTYGGETMQTPRIDQLASEGVLFEEGYVTNPICSPSRAGLLTGRNQSRFGFENNIHERYPRNWLEKNVFKYFLATDSWLVADEANYPLPEDVEKQGVPAEEIMLSELLHRVGYRTAVLGKWHLGYNDFCIPINRGFDYQYGFYEAYSLYQEDLESTNVVNQKLTDFSDPFLWDKGRSGTCAIRKNHVVVDEPGYLTDRIAEEAEKFITTNKDTSFFLYVSFNAPHTPFQAQKKYYDMYSHIEDPTKRIYYAMIKNLDDAVGRINDRLKEEGLEENTLLVFLSDNGGATYTLATDNKPLKGGKMTHFEGGLNVPFMMKWKGQIVEGSSFNKPIVSTDLFSTVTAMLNLDLPVDRVYDGINLMEYLANDQVEPHDQICWRSDYLRSIRKGEWKLIEDRLGGETVLYRITSDKFEKQNVSGQFPEVVKELKQNLDAWEAECESRKWPRVMDFKYTDAERSFYFPL